MAKRVFKADLKTLCDLHNLVAAGEALEWENIRGAGQEQHCTPGVRFKDGKLVNPIPTSKPKKIEAQLKKSD